MKKLVTPLILIALFLYIMLSQSNIYAETSNDFTYQVNSDSTTVTITKYTGNDSEPVVPSKIEGMTVTEIANNVFPVNVNAVVIPQTVIKIAVSAFGNFQCIICGYPGSFAETYADMRGFIFVNLESELYADGYICGINEDETLTIKSRAAQSDITSLDIPTELKGKTVTGIDSNAIALYGLEQIYIPETITSIGDGIARACMSLKEIAVADANPSYRSSDGILFSRDMTELIEYPAARAGESYAVPDPVTIISPYAFMNAANLVSVTMNDSVSKIGRNAFANCASLKNAELSEKITEIPVMLFSGCRALTDIVIKDGVQSMGANAFRNSGLKTIVIPKSVNSIADTAFNGITELTIYGVTGSYAETFANEKSYTFVDISTRPTPEPTATPEGTSTPEPTEVPTSTAVPTAAPVPTATSDPMELHISNFSNNRLYVDIVSGYPMGGTVNFTVIAAKYSDDMLSDILIQDVEVSTYGVETTYHIALDREISNNNDNEYIKFMLWDDLENCMPLCKPYTVKKVTAFPGAEGGGQYATGARGYGNTEVYHVTNLDDSGSGSFREAVSKPGRIVVFDVGGTINLKSSIRNIIGVTILGQTAPGDGITITGANLELGGSDIIRYLRIRPTFVNKIEADALGGYPSGTIIDHCSVSYSIDEALSIYNCSDTTVQNCISSESLKNGGHSKGAHGYGGIWGGTNASFHHNLLASHDSRNPRLAAGRLEGDIDYDMSEQATLTDLRNNIIYNWGGNSAYGGQGAMAANIINSYYKPGPSTTSHRSRIFQTTSTGNGITSKWATDLYVDGNYMEGSEAVTADNSKGVDHDSTVAQYYVWTKDNITDEARAVHFKYEDDYPVTTQTAEETYDTLLDHIGASLPRRDETDARIISEVRNGQGRIIDNEAEVGGVMQYPTVYRWFEIPQEWKDANGMGGAYEGDIVPDGRWKGYTWIEAYVNEWTEQQENPTNPDVMIQASANGNNITVSAEASPVGGSPITKIVIYDGDKIISEHETDKVNVNIDSAAIGTHYISVLAYNQKGESTRSTIAVVEVK